MAKRNPRGWGQYRKLTKNWNKYVMKNLLPKMLKEFPTTKGMTQKAVAQLLVREDWIETIQRYTWRASRATGMTVLPSGVPNTYINFKDWLVAQKMYDGTTVNAWKNSYVRNMAKTMVKRIKKNTLTLNQRLTKLDKTDDIAYVAQVFKTVKNPSRAMKKQMRRLNSDWDTMSVAGRTKALNAVKGYITKDITTNQYQAVLKDTMDKVNKYQGNRLSQDQLQRANNVRVQREVEEYKKEGKPEAVLVGYWSLSPDHEPHYYPDGEDPCEVHAEHDAGYGEGSYVGDDIKIPVRDSHFGCKCSLKMVVEKKK